jgi:hypothetical protein
VTALSRFRIEGLSAVTLAFLCVALAGANLLLFSENRSLNRELRGMTEARIGSRLPSMRAIDLDGKPTEIAWASDSRRTLLLVFARGCGACDRAWPIWQQALSWAPQAGIRVLYIDLSRALDRGYLERHNVVATSTVRLPDPATAFLVYNLRTTPQAILVSPEGRVLDVWAGVPTGARRESLFATTRSH